jgi:hypothetical protein
MQRAVIYKVDSATADSIRDLKLQSIEVDRRRVFMQYQYDHFKLVSTGMCVAVRLLYFAEHSRCSRIRYLLKPPRTLFWCNSSNVRSF